MNRVRLLLTCLAIAVALGLGAAALAPVATAASGVTIYPNISDSRCGFGGAVKRVQIAAVPGNSKNWTAGRWVSLQVPRNTPIKIIANVDCATLTKRGGGKFVVVQGYIPSATANKSYWF